MSVPLELERVYLCCLTQYYTEIINIISPKRKSGVQMSLSSLMVSINKEVTVLMSTNT